MFRAGPFQSKRIGQWRHHRSIFGDWNGAFQKENDPYLLANAAEVASMPYFYLACGDKEGLLAANRKLEEILAKKRFSFEFHVRSGGHDWNQWNAALPEAFAALRGSITAASTPPLKPR